MMKKNHYTIIGVMSGTSLDGVDLAHLKFELHEQKWSFKILECETVGYSQKWIQTLQSAVDFSEKDLLKLNIKYTKLLASVISTFIEKYTIDTIDAVCSHGHTVLHQPSKGVTLQIGNLPEISKLIHQNVVCDFRVQDVELGGQGAPLVPIGDRILFPEYDYCINLGGFSNVSFDEKNQRVAFDISPVNTVLNYYANHLGLDFDDKGHISKSGKIDENLLNQLNTLEFYSQTFPKSLGFEFVKETVLPIIESYDISIEDKLRTFTEHIAQQTASALNSLKNKDLGKAKVLITGGGAYNDFLMERVHYYLPTIEIIIPANKILEYKEALIFGFLGVLKLRGEINVLKSVTGAKKDHCSGKIFWI